MRDQAHENLIELLQRFMDEPAARTAQEDILAGERFLDARPAPAPDARVITAIKVQMAASAHRRHRTIRLFRGALATAAAVIVLGLIGPFGPDSTNRSRMSYAAIMPAAIWESDNLAVDDLDIVYFTAEIRHIETQMQALESDEGEIGGGGPDELESELMAIETEFWKG